MQQQHWLYLPPTTRTSFLFEWRAAEKDWIFGRAPLGNDWAYSLLSGSVTWGLAPGTWVQMVEGHIDLLWKTFAEIEWYSWNTYITVLHLSAMQYTQVVVSWEEWSQWTTISLHYTKVIPLCIWELLSTIWHISPLKSPPAIMSYGNVLSRWESGIL